MDTAARPTDETLLASALDGDESAWVELVNRYDLQGVGYAYGQVLDYDAVADIMQAHWTELVKAVREKPPVCFRAFFWKLLKCRIVDWIRKKSRSREFATLNAPLDNESPDRGPAIDLEASNSPDLVDIVIQHEEQELLHRALVEMPLNYRLTIQARLLEDRSVQETAQILLAHGLINGDGNVQKQVYNLDYRAQKELARRLRELGYEGRA